MKPVRFTLLSVLLVACGHGATLPYRQHLAEGERASSAGRHRDAATGYASAVADALAAGRERDADHARVLQAAALEKAGDLPAARALYGSMARREGQSEASVHGRFRLAELQLLGGDEGAGLAAMDRLLRDAPNSGLARPALARVLRGHDEGEGGAAAALGYLQGLVPAIRGTELEETVAYGIALRLATLGRAQAAHDAFLDVATRFPYPVGKLFDDALVRAAELDEGLGRPREAAHHLETLLAERETTSFMGSYQRPRYGPALFHLAELYRDKLGDSDAARGAFRKLATEFTTSILRDDAYWAAAQVLAQRGDGAGACRDLGDLVREVPDSRYVPCALERCPALSAPAKRRGRATCPPYLGQGAVGALPGP